MGDTDDAKPRKVSQVDGLTSSIGGGRRAEGVAWRSTGGSVLLADGRVGPDSFKIISNGYLVKQAGRGDG